MNVWIFNPYEPLPHEGAVRLRYASLAERLIVLGHEVTWWSVDWSHPLKQVRPVPPSGDSVGLRVVQLSVRKYRKNISIDRILSHRDYAAGIERDALSHSQEFGKPDVILFSIPPMESGRVALALGQQFGAKVVLDVMDAWPETLELALQKLEIGAWKLEGLKSLLGGLCLWPYRRMMRYYCLGVDAICAQSEAFVQHAVSYGSTHEIPVFYLSSEKVDLKSRLDEGTDALVRVVYLGSMGRVYDLASLVDAVCRIRESGHNICLDIIGEGESRPSLEIRAEELGASDYICFHGYQQGAALESLMSKADIGVIPMYEQSGVAIPYKASHYLSYGLALVSSLGGELAAMLSEYECGNSYTAGDVKSLQNALSEILADPEKIRLWKKNSLRLFNDRFERNATHQRMAEWLVQVSSI